MTIDPNLEADVTDLKLTMLEIAKRIDQFNQDLAQHEKIKRAEAVTVEKPAYD